MFYFNFLFLSRAEDAELQEAIRRSLAEDNSRPSRGGSQSEPRGYTPTRLYPNLPAQPSAPPPEHDNSYQDNGYQDYHDPSQAPRLPADLDEIRRRRVQRFEWQFSIQIIK